MPRDKFRGKAQTAHFRLGQHPGGQRDPAVDFVCQFIRAAADQLGWRVPGHPFQVIGQDHDAGAMAAGTGTSNHPFA